MKVQLIQRVIENISSLAFQDYSATHFLKVWHYHPEFELNVILEGTGTSFVGDSSQRFEAGDVVLIGKNIPHLWLNDEAYFEKKSKLIAHAQIINFPQNFGGGFFQIPELADVTKLLERSKQGIKFTGEGRSLVVNNVGRMTNASAYERVIIFIETLKLLAGERQYKLLSSVGYSGCLVESNKDRLLPVYEYIMNNFRKEVNLNTAAALANMNTSSFSRYFAKVHNKTFTHFVAEIRIGYACKVLIETGYVAGACYDSGFNNISNFNRQFKEIKNITPSDYIRVHSFQLH